MGLDREKQYPWFKMWSKGWLTGTIRATMTLEERSVWADLLAMANESRTRGVICRAEGIPFTRQYLADYLGVPIEILNNTVNKCMADKNVQDDQHRIEIDGQGCIHVTNWEYYQAVPDGKRLVYEDAKAKELRERRKVRQGMEKYPDEARTKLVELQNRERLSSQAKDAVEHIKE